MPKVVKKAPAKKAPAKKAPAKKKAAESTGTRGRSSNGLNGSHVKILQALKSGKAMSRADLSEATGIGKGWSKLLGNKEGTHEDALESRGFIKSEVPPEGERGLRYKITGPGKQALTKAEKELAKAGKD